MISEIVVFLGDISSCVIFGFEIIMELEIALPSVSVVPLVESSVVDFQVVVVFNISPVIALASVLFESRSFDAIRP